MTRRRATDPGVHVERVPGSGSVRFAQSESLRAPTWVYRSVAKNMDLLRDAAGCDLSKTNGAIDHVLGTGSYGSVFLLEDGRALKVTSDDAEGPCTLAVMKLQRGGATFGKRKMPVVRVTAQIDHVFRFPRKVKIDSVNTVVYGVIRELVGPPSLYVPKAFVEAADSYTDGWDYYCDADTPGGRIIGSALARSGLKKIKKSGRFGARLGEFLDFMWVHGRPLMDPHSGNLARRLEDIDSGGKRGDVVLFDLGASEDIPTNCVMPQGRSAVAVVQPVSVSDLASEIAVLGG